MDNVIRPATTEEKKDFVEIRQHVRLPFEKKLAVKRLEFTKAHKPFCARCAQLDYKDKVEEVKRELERSNGIAQSDDEKIMKIDFDIDEYGKASRFELLEVSEIREQKLIDGVRTNYVSGFYENFRCKKRGCGVTVEIPKDVWDERPENKKKEVVK